MTVCSRAVPGRHAGGVSILTAAAVAASALLTGAPARAEEGDPWLGRDKALHFGASAAISSAGYGVSALFCHDVRVRLATGAAAGLAAGVGKELWDLSGHGDASFRDLTWDLAGTVTGLALAAAIDWAVGQLRAAPNAPTATAAGT